MFRNIAFEKKNFFDLVQATIGGLKTIFKMATSFKKTSVKPAPKIGEKITTDTIYWKNLEVINRYLE